MGRSVPIETRLDAGSRVNVAGCLIWRGASVRGYGYIWYEGRNRRAHRVSYEISIGPIPGGMQLDHLCGEPSCINPAHLEPVTNAENKRRASERRKRCRKGHTLTQGGACQECKRASFRRWYLTRSADYRERKRSEARGCVG